MQHLAMMKLFFAITVLTTGLTCLVAEAAKIKLGPVISATYNETMTNATIYPIYFGQWDSSRIAKIQKFLKDIGGSRWFLTDKRNYGLKSLKLGKKLEIQSNLTQLNQFGYTDVNITDKTEAEFSQSEVQVMDTIHQAMRARKLPTDSNGIYLFFPADGVDVLLWPNKSRWERACGIHHHFLSDTGQGQMLSIKYAVVPDRADCSQNRVMNASPLGGDYRLEAIMSTTYHELVETMTNPTGRGYKVVADGFYTDEYENADLCERDFGIACEDETRALFNTVIGGVKYMLQTNYNPKLRKCGNLGAYVRQEGETCVILRPKFYSNQDWKSAR